jgi:nitrite reductase/ring-hydroxylating ferredoxin subunit
MAITVGKADDITPGQVASFTVEGKQVAVANIEGKLYAFSDICTHMGCQLSEGPTNGNVIACACHGSQFDMTSGVVVRGPAWMPLATYTVEVADGEIRLEPVVYEEEAAPEPEAKPAPAAKAAPAPAPAAEARPAVDAGAAIDALSRVPMFSGLGREALENLQAFTFRRQFKAGSMIVEEGRTGNGLYVVLSGRVEVVKGIPAGRPEVVAALGPGEPFGEMALLGEWPRTASVRAVEDSECLGMDRWVFMHQVRREPEVALKMLQVLAQRLAKTNERIVE